MGFYLVYSMLLGGTGRGESFLLEALLGGVLEARDERTEAVFSIVQEQ